LYAYERSRMAQWDNDAVMNTACMEARIEGKAEGKIEGKIEGKAERDLEIARSMKKDGIDPAVIAKYTGLSLKEIRRLE